MPTDQTASYTRREPPTISRLDVGLVIPTLEVGIIAIAADERQLATAALEPHAARVHAAELLDAADQADRIRERRDA